MRTSRALGIVHLAIFEAVDAISRTHKSYKGLQAKILVDANASGATPATASTRFAIAYAALDTLNAVYPRKSAFTSLAFNKFVLLATGETAAVQALGAAIGQAAAAEVLATRGWNGTNFGDNAPNPGPGQSSLDLEVSWNSIYSGAPTAIDWQQDPISQLPFALGADWNQVKPFVLTSLPLPPAPPKPSDTSFQDYFSDAATQGGDPNAIADALRFPTKTLRSGAAPKAPLTPDNSTFNGRFWGYDGTALLCAPPRLYNELATSLALQERPITSVSEFAYYLALVNVAMAEAGIVAWNAKYHYHYARPVTYIRSLGASQKVLGAPDSQWTPLGAPATNATQAAANLTPPFPAYPSGHATFGGTLFQILRLYFDTAHKGDISFSFVSDEYNGINKGPDGNPRPRVVRKFTSLTDAEYENARSRIWIGVHWQFDADAGVALGNQIANSIFVNAFTG